MVNLKERVKINNSTTIQQPECNVSSTSNNHLTMISNILEEPTMNNKELLIRDILNKSWIRNILNQPINNNLKETLINNILKRSMTNKILAQPINNKEYLIKEPTINKS